jgi:hypothetical protein
MYFNINTSYSIQEVLAYKKNDSHCGSMPGEWLSMEL